MFYNTWYNDCKKIYKLVIPSPSDMLKKPITIDLIYWYLNNDINYNLFNIFCSDEMI